MMKKVQNTKKAETKTESTKVSLEVNKVVDSMLVLVFLVMVAWPRAFVKLADVAQNGGLLDKLWWSLVVTVVLAIYAGIISFGGEKIKNNKKRK